ncbi:MAG: AAA family ATPase [Alphaproteobacteria bacterium]
MDLAGIIRYATGPAGMLLLVATAAGAVVVAVVVGNTPQYLRWRASKGSLRALLKLTAPLVRPDPVAKAEWDTLSEYSKRNVSWAMFALGTKLSSQTHSNFNYNQLVGYLWVKKAAEFNHPGAIDTLRRASIRDEPRYAPPSTSGGGGSAAPAPEKDHAIIHHPKAGHDPFKELAGLIGLSGIKTAVTNIAHRARLFEKRRSQGLSNSVPAMHLIFMGNPGTGKTIVARIIGGVLKQAGYLKSGHVVEVSVPELISQYVGETPLKVREKVAQAIDGVLFIDEAYGLMGHSTSSGSSYGAQAITTLLKLMEDNRENLVVIAAGYPAEMQAFLDVNPGFRSRFTDIIHFEDYTPDELVAIFTKLVKDQQFSLYPSAAVFLGDVMKQARAELTHNFPNGRFVRNLFENSVKNLAARVGSMDKHSKKDLQVLKAEDIKLAFKEVHRNQKGAVPGEAPPEGETEQDYTPPSGDGSSEQWDPPVLPVPLPLTAADPFSQLEGMIGLVDIKRAVSDIGNRARLFGARQAQGLPAVRPVIHMALLGNPGTGKTTVARIMGEILHQTGYLTRGHVVEVLVSDLMGDNAGDTAQRVRQHVMRALDGVLLLDNAYKLADEQGRATTTALVKLMEDYKDRLVVIAAGYADEMQHFLDSDPGLRSRFTDVIRFADYTPEELLALYRQMAVLQQYKITPAAEKMLEEFFRHPPGVSTRSFSNGRLVRNIFEDSVKCLAARTGGKMIFPSREDLETIKAEDVQLACDEARAQEERTAA